MIADPNSNRPVSVAAATSTNGATFQINNTKLVVSVVTLSIKENIKFLENLKQRFRRTISWNKYKSEITMQTKNNNLDYMIGPTLENFNWLFVLSFKNSINDPTINSFDKCYMPPVEINYFNVLIDNEPFFDVLWKTRKTQMKTCGNVKNR